MRPFEERLEALKGSGRKLLGCFPLYPPVALFHAMGLEPVVLWGLKPFFPETPHADRRVQNFVCSVGRHLAECVLADAGAQLDGLFMYNACDTLRNLPEILESGLQEAGRHLPVFKIHVPMVPQRQVDASLFLKQELERLIQSLERGLGCTFSRSAFEKGLSLYHRAWGLAGEAEEAVARGRISFREFAETLQGNFFRPVEQQIQRMEELLAKAAHNEEAPLPRARVILSGIMPPPPQMADLLEQEGLRVVGNDIASLARTYRQEAPAPASPGGYYVDFYEHHHPCPTLLGTADRRVGYLEAFARERGAQGIIFLGEKFCEYEYFEFPYLEKRFREMGLHTLLLEFSMDDEENVGAFATRIEAFAELMG